MFKMFISKFKIAVASDIRTNHSPKWYSPAYLPHKCRTDWRFANLRVHL